jgi:hypothetical protein
MLDKELKKLKKKELIKINKSYGYNYNKKTTNKILIENLLKIYRIKDKIENIDLEECPICYTQLNKLNYMITKCGHFFCKECIFIYINQENEICPLCRNDYTYDDFVESISEYELNILLSIIFSKKIVESKNPKNFIFYLKILLKLMIRLLQFILLYKCIEFLYKLLNNDFST